MLENLYTTKMSMDKEKLQARFAKIQAEPGRRAKGVGVVVFVLLLAIMAGTSACIAIGTAEDYAMTDQEFSAYISQPIGAVMADLDYADENILVLHYGDGFFVLNQETRTIRHAVDLSKLNITTQPQGDVTLEVTVDKAGSHAYLSALGPREEIKSYDDYVIDLDSGQVKKGTMPADTEVFRGYSDTFAAIPDAAGWYSSRCITAGDRTYYLSAQASHVGNMELVTLHHDGSPAQHWYLFGEASIIPEEDIPDLYDKAVEYMAQEYHRVYDPYYDIQNLTLSAWKQNGNEATFFYTMTYLYYNRDPDKAAYIQEAKKGNRETYESLYKDYLALKEANCCYKVVWNGKTFDLYCDVSLKGPSVWHGPMTVDDFIAS